MTDTVPGQATGAHTATDLVNAYRTMRTIRAFEERVHDEFATGDIPGFVHLYAGQEASAAGVCAHLDDRDTIASTHRGHGHCIAKGVDVTAMMAEIFGRGTGACKGKGGSMHIADLSKGMLGANGIVGGGPPLICGTALAGKLQGHGAVSVAFFGDGASNQGTTLESMNLASIWNLPAIFVAENNGYAEATASTWSVAADTIAYRADEVAHARANLDCLLRFRRHVTSTGEVTTTDLDTVDAEVAALVDTAVTQARSAAKPTSNDLETDVYVTY